MKLLEFRDTLFLPHPRPEIFDFFAQATNLQEITPPWLHFHLLSPPGEIHQGIEIDYRLKIHAIPVRWRSKITVWDPPTRFVDEQLRGPYRVWIHEHRFTDQNGGTLCEDHVRYAVPGGALIAKLFVNRDIRTIFNYRSKRLKEIFP
jgi:ligand-binding SRPBCC domain-containing protein